MEDLLKYKWALIGTIVLHILLAFSFSQMKFEGKFEAFELTEMPVLLEEPDEEELKKQEELNKAQLTESGKVSNQTFNEADKMGQTNEAYDSRKFSNVDEKVEDEVKDLEKQFFDEMKNNRESKYGTYDPAKNQKTSDKKKTETTESGNTTNSNTNRTMSVSRVAASYDLKGRRDEIFVKPSYICKGTGSIVLKIKVNRSGKVMAADVDMSVSTYTEECMLENAKKYALRCKFEAGTSFPEPQSGTITYTFIAQ